MNRLSSALSLSAATLAMIALTGWGREDDVRRTQEAGFDHHLVKPVAPEKLSTLLKSVAAARSEAGAASEPSPILH